MKASQQQGAEQFSESRRSAPTATDQTMGPTPPDGKPPNINRRMAIVAGSVSMVTLFGGALVIRSLSAPPPKPLASTSATGPSTPAGSPPGNAQALAQMSPQEYAAFKPIVEPDLASTNQDDSSPCKELLARLALMPSADARGEIRVISGAYTSPTFLMSMGPTAIPIPFPAPYATGKGVLIIEGTAESGVLGLTPGFPLNLASNPVIQIPVWWPVDPNCR